MGASPPDPLPSALRSGAMTPGIFTARTAHVALKFQDILIEFKLAS